MLRHYLKDQDICTNISRIYRYHTCSNETITTWRFSFPPISVLISEISTSKSFCSFSLSHGVFVVWSDKTKVWRETCPCKTGCGYYLSLDVSCLQSCLPRLAKQWHSSFLFCLQLYWIFLSFLLYTRPGKSSVMRCLWTKCHYMFSLKLWKDIRPIQDIFIPEFMVFRFLQLKKLTHQFLWFSKLHPTKTGRCFQSHTPGR